MKTSKCLWDEFTTWFLGKHDIDSELGRTTLILIMLLGFTDTARIECWHAWTRRIAMKLGLQTLRPSSADVAGRGLAKQIRTRGALQSQWRSNRPPSSTFLERHKSALAEGARDQEAPPKKARRVGGGAWRAHVSRGLKDGIRNFEALAASYKERTPAQVRDDEERGALATAAHRQGVPSFGPRTREIEAARLQNLAVVFDRQHALSDVSFAEQPEGALQVQGYGHDVANFDNLLQVLR